MPGLCNYLTFSPELDGHLKSGLWQRPKPGPGLTSALRSMWKITPLSSGNL